MKDIETPDKKNLGRLLEELNYGNYIIPDFQREFDWSPADVKELLKSIFEDYYIGTLLLWKASKDNQRLLSCEPIYGFEGKSDPQHIVLDGQQRLSAIYYAFFNPQKNFPKRKNRYLFTIKLDKLLEGVFEDVFDYEWLTKKVENFLNNKEKQFEDKILPVCVLGEKYWYEWFREYEKYWAKKIGKEKAEEEKDKLEDLFKDFISRYDVSYIELDRDIDVSKVCDIFTRINNTGIPLTIFDLLNALMTPKGVYLKNMWRKESQKLDNYEWERTRVHVLQIISILEQGYCAPKYLYYLVPGTKKLIKKKDGSTKEIVLLKSPEDFIERWNLAFDRLKETLKSLANPRDYGAIKPDFLPYPTMAPILTVLNIEKEQNANKAMDIDNKIKKWYWSSIFMQNYSSAVDSQMTSDYYAMREWFKNDSAVPRVIEQFEGDLGNLDFSYENSATSAIYKAILNILIKKGARDLITFALPEYSSLEGHHIVPQSWGIKNGLKKDIDSVLNKTPLSKETNRKVIKDRLPNVYLKEILDKSRNKEEVYKLLESHMISKKAIDILLRNPFSANDYKEFIVERQKTIIQEIKDFLSLSESKNNDEFISPDTPFSNILQIEKTIKKCEKFIYWIDKYFAKAGLEILASGLSGEKSNDIRDIKIITSLDKVDEELRRNFKRFKEEFNNKGIKVEMRAIGSKKTKESLHDRYILSKYKKYNLPSPDVIKRGQYSEIKETNIDLPFDKWWKEGLDIVDDWNKVKDYKNK